MSKETAPNNNQAELETEFKSLYNSVEDLLNNDDFSSIDNSSYNLTEIKSIFSAIFEDFDDKTKKKFSDLHEEIISTINARIEKAIRYEQNINNIFKLMNVIYSLKKDLEIVRKNEFKTNPEEIDDTYILKLIASLTPEAISQLKVDIESSGSKETKDYLTSIINIYNSILPFLSNQSILSSYFQ
jgi:ElaB/YqjD/DUF883 family membrane-anchored ribosome-binding protein